jgi:hypothetical protein
MTTPSRTISRKAPSSPGITVRLLGLGFLSLCDSNNIRFLEKSLINKRSSGQHATPRRVASARFTAIRAAP